MKHQTKISAGQFFLLLFISHVITSITINAQTVGNSNFLDNMLSALLFAAVTGLFSIPIFALNHRYPEDSLPALAEKKMGGFGYGVSAVYGLYFLCMNIFSLTLFLVLLVNTINPSAAKWSIALVICGIALYGAVKGIETVSRAAICVFVIFLLSIGAIFISLIPNVDFSYTEPLFRDGISQTMRGFLVFSARSTSLAELAVLLCFVQGKKRKGFAFWLLGVVAFICILLFFIVSCLGEYGYFQLFPAYTLASVAEIIGIQRFDALFIGICMMTLVIRIACGLFAISECVSRVSKPRTRTVALCILTAFTAVAALWISGNATRMQAIFRTEIMLPFTVLTAVILPVVVWLASFVKRGKRQ